MISNIKGDKKGSRVRAVNEDIEIAVGNTSSQALAALIAKVSGVADPATVELLLDALQLGKLKGITSIAELNRLEELQLALHTSGYNSTAGGDLWEVSKINDEDN